MSVNRHEEIELSNNQSNDFILVTKAAKSTFYERKHYSKPIRVLTVLAYILSVSLAAIILSAYYIFIWDGKPSLAYQSYLRTVDIYHENEDELDGPVNHVTNDLESSKFNGTNGDSLILDAIQKPHAYAEHSSNTSIFALNDEVVKTISNSHKDDSSDEVLQIMEPTINVEETAYLTTPIEENSTWLPEIINDFEADYNEFKTEPIFIKKLFGYHKVKVK